VSGFSQSRELEPFPVLTDLPELSIWVLLEPDLLYWVSPVGGGGCGVAWLADGVGGQCEEEEEEEDEQAQVQEAEEASQEADLGGFLRWEWMMFWGMYQIW
jgi:hypothetical protein